MRCPCQTRNGTETQRQVAAPGAVGRASAPEKTRPPTLHPANPFLCRRRKSANQPKLTDDRLTSTMSPTLNFDSVLDRTERRRRRLMVALVLYRGTIAICSRLLSLLCAVRVFFVRTSSQVEINHSGAQYFPELLWRNRQISCSVSGQNRPNPPKRTKR